MFSQTCMHPHTMAAKHACFMCPPTPTIACIRAQQCCSDANITMSRHSTLQAVGWDTSMPASRYTSQHRQTAINTRSTCVQSHTVQNAGQPALPIILRQHTARGRIQHKPATRRTGCSCVPAAGTCHCRRVLTMSYTIAPMF